MPKALFAFALVVLSTFFLSNTSRLPVAPAGSRSSADSELVLLMRSMYDDVANMKASVKKRKKAVPRINHEFMLNADATEPAKTASPAYRALAEAYLKTLKALQEAGTADAPALYKELVDSCMSCHSAFCPGPKTRIKNLY